MYNKVITIEWGRGYYGKGRCDLTHNLNATYVESDPWLSTLGGIGPNQDIYCWLLLEPLQLVFYLETTEQLKEHWPKCAL